MNTRASSAQIWRSLHRRLPPGGQMTILKAPAIPHPREAGARPAISWPVGQLADYALDVGVGVAPLFIREFVDRYEAAVAGVELAERTVALAKANPKAALCVGGALLGATVAAALSRKADAAALGAALGALAAVLLHTHLEQETLP